MFGKETEEGVSGNRRTVLKTIAGGSVGLVGGIGTAAGQRDRTMLKKQTRMQKKFDDTEELVQILEPTVPLLLDKLVSEGVLPKKSKPSVRGLVNRSEVSIVVAPVGGEAVTHIQLSPKGFDVSFVHQKESRQTNADVESQDGGTTYTATNSSDSITTLGCFYTGTSCCGGTKDCETSNEYDNDYYRYEKKCCCCGSTSEECYWIRTDTCCTDGECFL